MELYSSPNIPVVPRLIPSQASSKRIPMSDDGYQYVDNRPNSSYLSPTSLQNNSQPLSAKSQLNYQDNFNPNQSFNPNYQDNSFKGQTNKTRLHHEALKDNSGDGFPMNSSNGYGYPLNSDYRSFDNSTGNHLENKSTKTLIIIFGVIIGLFSVTALAISIYLLIKITNNTISG